MMHPDSNLDDGYFDWPDELSLAEQMAEEADWQDYYDTYLKDEEPC